MGNRAVLIALVKKLEREVEITVPSFLHGDLGYVEQKLKFPACAYGKPGSEGTVLTDEEYKMFDAVMKGKDFDA